MELFLGSSGWVFAGIHSGGLCLKMRRGLSAEEPGCSGELLACFTAVIKSGVFGEAGLGVWVVLGGEQEVRLCVAPRAANTRVNLQQLPVLVSAPYP